MESGNPRMTAASSPQTLNRHQVGPEEQASFYQFMLDDLDRLDHLITQVLEAGRLDTESACDEREDVVMGALTTKLVIGIELGPNNFQPTAVVMIPTAALVRAARGILNTASPPNQLAFTKQVFESVLKDMAGDAKSNVGVPGPAKAG